MLEKIRKIGKIRAFFAYLGMIFVGLLFIVFSVIAMMSAAGTERIETTAEVVSVREVASATDDAVEYIAVIRYTVDGKTYETEFPVDSGTAAGGTVTVLYNADDPEKISSSGTDVIEIVFAVIGLAAVAFGIYSMVKLLRGASEPGTVDSALAADGALNENFVDPDAVSLYYFHFTGKLGQSFVLETETRQPRYEATCEKITFFRPTPYTFTDYTLGSHSEHLVTHTVTSSIDNGNVSTVCDSSFKIDGEKIWDVMTSRGLSFRTELSGLKMNYYVYRGGTKIAEIYSAGADVIDDSQNGNFLSGKLTANGCFRVRCAETDIADAFLCAFTFTKTELI